MNQRRDKWQRDPLPRIRECLRKQDYTVSIHALQRQRERSLALKEVLFVLKNGTHEKEKTLFDVKEQIWKYAIRGKTADGVELRVIIVFREKMAIITAIKLTRR